MCGADMDRIRDEMTEALAGVDPALDFEERCEVIVAFVISARSGATLPALPAMIQNRRTADRLADLVYDEMETLGDDPDRLGFFVFYRERHPCDSPGQVHGRRVSGRNLGAHHRDLA